MGSFKGAMNSSNCMYRSVSEHVSIYMCFPRERFAVFYKTLNVFCYLMQKKNPWWSGRGYEREKEGRKEGERERERDRESERILSHNSYTKSC